MDDVWPVAGIRIAGTGVVLRPATEAEIVTLSALLPDDYELDPTVAATGSLPRPLHLLKTYWRDQAAWSGRSWKLHLMAETPGGRRIGMQIMESEAFADTRTVESASWVSTDDRRSGFGRAMRSAMLAFAFDGLGARRAISSAWHDNLPSLAVSRGLGYTVDRIERRPRDEPPGAEDDLVHLHLDAETWRASPRAAVTLSGIEPALAAFGL